MEETSTTKQLAKATMEQVKEYAEWQKRASEFDEKFKNADKESYEKELALLNENLHRLENEYDWFNFTFSDPSTGKVGLMSVAGEVIAPAIFDRFVESWSYLSAPHAPVVAFKDGKCGIVVGDGSGKVLCEFKYDHIKHLPYTSLYLAFWGGEKKCFGVIAVDGSVVCPNILTSYTEYVNGIVAIQSNDKHGVIDAYSHQCILPEYDDVELDSEGAVIFYKDGQKGYVSTKGEFITVDQYENGNEYDDADLISTWLP